VKLLEYLKAILFGIVEGISEWLPISSTGHMIILSDIMPLDVSAEFSEVFFVVIQLGAILAVPIIFSKRIIPTGKNKREVLSLYSKLFVGCIPAALLGILLDDLIDRYFFNYVTVSVALLVYGVVFIVLEKSGRSTPAISSLDALSHRDFLLIGLFQSLSLIPGTSRSGVTIIGGMCLGADRRVASELSFLLAIPVMIGASGLKIFKFVFSASVPTAHEILILSIGFTVAFLVSVITVKFLIDFVGRHSFAVFGVYRIALSLVILVLFGLLRM